MGLGGGGGRGRGKMIQDKITLLPGLWPQAITRNLQQKTFGREMVKQSNFWVSRYLHRGLIKCNFKTNILLHRYCAVSSMNQSQRDY